MTVALRAASPLLTLLSEVFTLAWLARLPWWTALLAVGCRLLVALLGVYAALRGLSPDSMQAALSNLVTLLTRATPAHRQGVSVHEDPPRR